MLLGHTSVRTTELYLERGAEARASAVKAIENLLQGTTAEAQGYKKGYTGSAADDAVAQLEKLSKEN